MKKLRKSICIVLSACLLISLMISPALAVTVVKRGSTGTAVKYVQYNLNILGFSVGTVDGIAGTKTVAGIKSYQKSRGLAVDGIAGSATQSSLTSEVKEIQTLLKSKGYYTGSIDGIAGPNTISALKSFQSANGLSATGVVNSTTLSALKRTTATTTSSVTAFQNKVLSTWVTPVKASYLTVLGTGRAFGASRSGGSRKHAGIDYYVRNGAGTAVYAMQAGTVIEYSSNFYCGTSAVAIRHVDGSVARYCEISTLLRKGDTVRQGQKIATIKANTYDGGTMLHLELYLGTASGSLTSYSNTYSYVSGKFNRRGDLLNPEFLLNLK